VPRPAAQGLHPAMFSGNVLPGTNCYSLTDPGGMEGWVDLEIVSGSGICWAICKVCTSSQTTTPTTHHSVFYRPDALPAAQPTAFKALKAAKALKAVKALC